MTAPHVPPLDEAAAAAAASVGYAVVRENDESGDASPALVLDTSEAYMIQTAAHGGLVMGHTSHSSHTSHTSGFSGHASHLSASHSSHTSHTSGIDPVPQYTDDPETYEPAEPTETPTPTPTPSPTPTPTPSPTPTPTPTSEETETPTPEPIPVPEPIHKPEAKTNPDNSGWWAWLFGAGWTGGLVGAIRKWRGSSD